MCLGFISLLGSSCSLGGVGCFDRKPISLDRFTGGNEAFVSRLYGVLFTL